MKSVVSFTKMLTSRKNMNNLSLQRSNIFLLFNHSIYLFALLYVQYLLALAAAARFSDFFSLIIYSRTQNAFSSAFSGLKLIVFSFVWFKFSSNFSIFWGGNVTRITSRLILWVSSHIELRASSYLLDQKCPYCLTWVSVTETGSFYYQSVLT